VHAREWRIRQWSCVTLQLRETGVEWRELCECVSGANDANYQCLEMRPNWLAGRPLSSLAAADAAARRRIATWRARSRHEWLSCVFATASNQLQPERRGIRPNTVYSCLSSRSFWNRTAIASRSRRRTTRVSVYESFLAPLAQSLTVLNSSACVCSFVNHGAPKHNRYTYGLQTYNPAWGSGHQPRKIPPGHSSEPFPAKKNQPPVKTGKLGH